MHKVEYRVGARIVAFLDLVMTGMSFWIPCFSLYESFNITILQTNPELLVIPEMAINNSINIRNEEHLGTRISNSTDVLENIGTIAFLVWIFLVIIASGCWGILQLVATIKLVYATRIDAEASNAAKNGRFWQGTTFVFTALLILSCSNKAAPLADLVFNGVCVILRCVSMFVIQKYIIGLDKAVSESGIINYPLRYRNNSSNNVNRVYSYISPPNLDEDPCFKALTTS